MPRNSSRTLPLCTTTVLLTSGAKLTIQIGPSSAQVHIDFYEEPNVNGIERLENLSNFTDQRRVKKVHTTTVSAISSARSQLKHALTSFARPIRPTALQRSGERSERISILRYQFAGRRSASLVIFVG
jgi:hypothetical protein